MAAPRIGLLLPLLLLLGAGACWVLWNPSQIAAADVQEKARLEASIAEASLQQGQASGVEEASVKVERVQQVAAPIFPGYIEFENDSNWNQPLGTLDVWIYYRNGRPRDPFEPFRAEEIKKIGLHLRVDGSELWEWPSPEDDLWIYAEHRYLKSRVKRMTKPDRGTTKVLELDGVRELIVDVWDAEGNPVADVPVRMVPRPSAGSHVVEARVRTSRDGRAIADFDSSHHFRRDDWRKQRRVLEVPVLGGEPVRKEILGDELPEDGVRMVLPELGSFKIRVEGMQERFRGRIIIEAMGLNLGARGKSETRLLRSNQATFPRIGYGRQYRVVLQQSHQIGDLEQFVTGPTAEQREVEVVFRMEDRLAVSGRLLFPDSGGFEDFDFQFFVLDRTGAKHAIGSRNARGRFLLRLDPEWKGQWVESIFVRAESPKWRHDETAPHRNFTYPIQGMLTDSVDLGEMLPESWQAEPQTEQR